jgi:signal transduction histidine kinase
MAPSPSKAPFAALGAMTVCLPLVVSGALIGGLCLFWKEKRSFSDDESAFAKTLAGLCAQALDRARLFTAEREARERAVASERAVLDYQQRLQRMAFDRVVVEERERRRLATALHDGVTQYLALAKLTLDPVRERLEGAARTAIDAAEKLIADAIAETHSLSFELSPPLLYELGLEAALSWLGEKLEQGTGLRVQIAEDGTARPLDDVTASIVFRTVRELLMNVVKHAHAATAKVSLHHHPDRLEVLVEDAGTGFDPREMASDAGFGLMSVREQIGRLGGAVEITSAANEGTRVRVRVPSRLTPAASAPLAPRTS